MKNLIKLLLIFIVFLFIGCGNDPKPPKPVLQKTNPLENFDENWPPKEDRTPSIDLSDLQINKLPISTEDLQEFYNLPKIGNSTLFGKVAIIGRNKELISGSYANVYLIPKTSYSKKWLNNSYLSNEFYKSIDERVYDFIRFTKSNAKGDFSFLNIPKGRYYIIGVMNCGTECGFDSSKSVRMSTEIIVDKDGSVLKNIIKSL